MLSTHSPTTKWWQGKGSGASHQKGGNLPRPQGGCMVFAAKGGIKNGAPKGRRTSPAGTVSQPIGKPFNGQAKGLLWLTWRSYAGPPQYYIPPEGGAINPPVRRSRSQAEPWQPRAERPGGWLNPHARKGVSTFGNTGKPSSIHAPIDVSPQLPDFKSPRWDVSFSM